MIHSLVVNYTALYIAAIYYRQLSVEQALDAANCFRGYAFAPRREISVELARQAICVISRRKFCSFDALERKLKVNARTLCKLYILYKEECDLLQRKELTNGEMQEVIRMATSEEPIHKIAGTFHVSERHIIKLLRTQGKYKDIYSQTFKGQADADRNIQRTNVAKKYMSSFEQGDRVIVSVKGRKSKILRKTGHVVHASDNMVVARLDGYNTTITLGDLVSGIKKVKKYEPKIRGLRLAI
jgi:hypothetical protein